MFFEFCTPPLKRSQSVGYIVSTICARPPVLCSHVQPFIALICPPLCSLHKLSAKACEEQLAKIGTMQPSPGWQRGEAVAGALAPACHRHLGWHWCATLPAPAVARGATSHSNLSPGTSPAPIAHPAATRTPPGHSNLKKVASVAQFLMISWGKL